MNNTLVGLVVAGVAFVLDIIATAIPYWWRYSATGGSYNYGLFRYCVTVDSLGTNCAAYEGTPPDWLKATVAMMIMSILAIGACLLMALLYAVAMKEKTMLAMGAAVMALVGGILCLIGLIIFAAEFAEMSEATQGGLHASFGLAIVAAIVAFVAVPFFYMARNSASSS